MISVGIPSRTGVDLTCRCVPDVSETTRKEFAEFLNWAVFVLYQYVEEEDDVPYVDLVEEDQPDVTGSMECPKIGEWQTIGEWPDPGKTIDVHDHAGTVIPMLRHLVVVVRSFLDTVHEGNPGNPGNPGYDGIRRVLGELEASSEELRESGAVTEGAMTHLGRAFDLLTLL
jgi:hypothetical protein